MVNSSVKREVNLVCIAPTGFLGYSAFLSIFNGFRGTGDYIFVFFLIQ